MERNCEKCVYHTSGFCSKWKCEGTKTRKDIENEAYNKGRADLLKSIRECAKHLGYDDIEDLLSYVDDKEQKNE